MNGMIGARGTDGKAATGTVPGSSCLGTVPGSSRLPRYADLLLAGGLVAAGIGLCCAKAAARRADLADAGPPPDPAAVTHRVDLAAAGEAELRLLPGIGPRLAERMAAERAAGGPFADLEDLDRRVPGVGPARVRWWRGRVELPRKEGR
jgi:DNA uptake protein ComE-like DNA-binding protein